MKPVISSVKVVDSLFLRMSYEALKLNSYDRIWNQRWFLPLSSYSSLELISRVHNGRMWNRRDRKEVCIYLWNQKIIWMHLPDIPGFWYPRPRLTCCIVYLQTAAANQLLWHLLLQRGRAVRSFMDWVGISNEEKLVFLVRWGWKWQDTCSPCYELEGSGTESTEKKGKGSYRLINLHN